MFDFKSKNKYCHLTNCPNELFFVTEIEILLKCMQEKNGFVLKESKYNLRLFIAELSSSPKYESIQVQCSDFISKTVFF